MRVPAMPRIWLRPAHPSTGPARLLSSAVTGACQPEAVAKHPAAKHQRGDRGESAGEADPNPDAFPVARESQPGADPKTDHPIADQCKEQRPAGIMEAAKHPRANHLSAVDQLEGRGN